MAEQHGKTATVLANEFDVSSYNNSLNLGVSRAPADTSAFGDDDKTYLAGRVDGTYSLVGTWNDDAAADLEHATNLGLEVVYTAVPAGADTIGNAAFLWEGLQNSYGIPMQTTDAVRHNLGGLCPSARMGGQLLHALGTASTGASSSVDGAAQTTDGGSAHLHVTAFTGTSITVTVEDSANDSTWATLDTFTAQTGAAHERIEFTGTVERYVRVNISGTFSAATIAVAYARNRY